MQGRELRERGSEAVRNTPLPPGVQALMAEIELAPQELRSEIVDKLAMGVLVVGHGSVYQRSVDTSSPHSFMVSPTGLADKRVVGFGARLLAAIEAAGYKNQRRFAIDALGWDETSGPQRLSNYITRDRVPDEDTLRLIISKLKVSRDELLNEGTDAALRDILLHLFELEDIPGDKADTIATVFLEAKRLLSTFPEEGAPQMRARLAAHSAWHLQPPLEPGR